ncbi:carboxypeptidase regulatory-like domain-containing protein [Jatrophihabitans fulvus]
MRVSSESTSLAVSPGESTALTIDVRNTDDVIAGVSANVIGLATEHVTSEPRMLPLFPDSSGTLRVDLAVPRAHPAGRHSLTVELVSHGTAGPPDYLDVDLDVAADPGLRLTARPRVARARRSARYVLELVNTGNVPLDVTLKGVDVDRRTEVTFTPERRRVEPGTIVPILVRVKGPRMIFGSETERAVSVEALARQLLPGVAPALPPAEPTQEELADRWVSSFVPDEPAENDPVLPAEPIAAGELKRTVVVRLKQRALIGRGLLTILILMGILALWAGAFLFGLLKVFADDPVTKQAPASFFASLPEKDGGKGGAGGAAGNGAGAAGADVAPAGALDKSGQMPPGTGATVKGRVVGKADSRPVGRILVTAYRLGRDGKLVAASSAATQSDGTYALAGLFPTQYRIKFSRDGFDTVWFPGRTAQAQAQWVAADPQATKAGVNAVMTGHKATISGLVDDGSSSVPPRTKVTARPLLGASTGTVAASATTNAAGAYKLVGLAAPASYELTFQTPGYQPSTLTETVSGGDRRIEPTVLLGANQGSITGLVTSGGQPLGGATVSTTVDGRKITVGTPTTGQVGRFVISGLRTPDTYVVTVSSPKRGTVTRVVALKAGQQSADLTVALRAGDNSLLGSVKDTNGDGIGGATVTVTDSSGGPALSTSTLTGGTDKGSFIINGASGGSLTITASAPNYESATVVTTGSGPTPPIVLRQASGTLTGIVRAGGNPAAGAAIRATNGLTTYTTTANSSDGRYTLSGLPGGTYSVTATLAGYQQSTAIVTLESGGRATAGRLVLPKPER